MSAPVQSIRQKGELSAGIRATLHLLLGSAILIDGYLAWVSLTAGTVAGCGPASNCHAVLNSKWAYWFGVPVSLFGLLVYMGLLGSTFFLGPKTPPLQRRKAWQILMACAMAVLGAGLWFVSIQLFVLKTICPFCMTAHTCAMAAAALILLGAPIRKGPEKHRQRAQQVFVSPQMAQRLGLGAGAALVLLVTGQLVQKPKSYVSMPIAAGVRTNDLAPSLRQFQIFDGQFVFNLDEVPLMGRPDAPHTMVSLFDYTCHHCRDMHGPLREAYHRFSNELAIVSLPMPLDGKCNPIVKRTQPAHVDACALARLGLTVWLADRKAALLFDEWMFSSGHPPQPAAAEQRARELVGAEAFERAATNQWIDQQIRQDVSIFEAVYRRFKKGFMPQIIIGTNLISGASNRDQLFQVLSDQFGLYAK